METKIMAKYIVIFYKDNEKKIDEIEVDGDFNNFIKTFENLHGDVNNITSFKKV